MSNYWGKQPGSRPTLTTTTTAVPTKAGAQTYQLRVAATAAGLFGIFDSSSTSAGGVVVQIAAATVGEYFTITPGQWY